MNKHIIVGALAGLFSLGAFAQASAPVVTHNAAPAAMPAPALAPAPAPATADAASAVTHKHAHKHAHKHHNRHHASAVSEGSAPAADAAPVTKP